MRYGFSKTALAASVAMSLVVSFAGSGRAAGQNQRIQWYAVDDELNTKGQSLNLGDSIQSLPLQAGWVCTVGATSKQLPAYEARTTVCQKAAEAFEFTVQCERSRPKDHTQIRFRVGDRLSGDFVEIGCELI